MFPRPLAWYCQVFSVVQGIIFLGANLKACLAMNDFWLTWHRCTRQGETEVPDPNTVPRSPDTPSAHSNVSFASDYETG